MTESFLHLRSSAGPRALLLSGCVLTALAAGFIYAWATPGLGVFEHLLYVEDLPAAALLFFLMVFVTLCPGNTQSASVAWLARHSLAVALTTFALLAGFTLAVYRNHPLSMDEYAAWYQARLFAGGALAGHLPPELVDLAVPKGFQNHFFIVNHVTGRIASAYWPGFSLLLAPFMLLGIPWACNPLLVALSLLLLCRIAGDLFRSNEARGWTMLLALASPAFTLNGISFYSMPAHLLLNLAFAWLLLEPTKARCLLAGLVGGSALSLHNPFPHLVFGLPWLVSLALRGPERWKALACVGAGYAILALPLLVGWSWFLTNLASEAIVRPSAAAAHAARSPGEQLWLTAVGFLRYFHLPDENILAARLGGLAKLWLWSAPLLPLLAWPLSESKGNLRLQLFWASAALTFFAYFLIPFDQGHGWGYRYFHSAFGALPLLAAATLLQQPTWREPVFRLCVLSVVLCTGLRLWQIDDFVDRQLTQSPPVEIGSRCILFHSGRGWYPFDLIQNDPWLKGPLVRLFARADTDDAAILRKYFPGNYHQLSNRYGRAYCSSSD